MREASNINQGAYIAKVLPVTMPSNIINPGTLAKRRANAAKRKRTVAKQILAREKFQSALSRRLQLELRKSSTHAKSLASRITSVTPRGEWRGVKKLNLAELINADKKRRREEAERRRAAAAAAKKQAAIQPTATPAVHEDAQPQRVDSPEQIKLPEGAFRIPLTGRGGWQRDRHDIWADILTYRHKQEQAELQLEREQLQKKRAKQAQVLRQQVALKEQQARAAKLAVQRDLVRVQTDVEAFHQEEAAKQNELRHKSKHIMKQMITQRDQHLAHRQRVRARRLAEERAYIQRIEEEERAAKRAEKEKRKNALREMRKVQIENERQLEIKRQEKLAEQRRTAELQKEAIAMLDAREARRVAEFEERSRLIREKVARMNTFMAKVLDKEAEDLAKAIREREAHEREQDRLAAERKAAAKKRLEDQHRVLQEQIELKKALEEARVRADLERAKEMRAKVQEDAMKERQEREAQFAQERAYKEELRRQIVERAHQRVRPDQTDLDQQLNQQLLESMRNNVMPRPPSGTRKRGARPTGGGRRVVS